MGSLKPNGILVRPTAAGEQSEVSLCALLHKDTVRLLSGDLLGEKLLFWRTLENLLFALETLCPLPVDFNHPLRAHQERCLSESRSRAKRRVDGHESPRSPVSPSSNAS